jgi:hypothetical protein
MIDEREASRENNLVQINALQRDRPNRAIGVTSIGHVKGRSYKSGNMGEDTLCLLLTSCCFAYSLTLKMESVISSEPPVNFRGTIQCHIAIDSSLPFPSGLEQGPFEATAH